MALYIWVLITVLHVQNYISHGSLIPEKGSNDIVPDGSYMAEIFMNDNFICSGCIVNEKWILTSDTCAAKIFDSGDDSKNKVILGIPKQKRVQNKFDERIKAEAQHNTPIALLRLNKKSRITKTINVIPLVKTAPDKNFVTENILIQGFKQPSGDSKAEFLSIRGTIHYGELCTNMKQHDFCISKTYTPQICDISSGAALVRDGHLLGLMYSGQESCERDGYALFVKYDAISDFLQKISHWQPHDVKPVTDSHSDNYIIANKTMGSEVGVKHFVLIRGGAVVDSESSTSSANSVQSKYSPEVKHAMHSKKNKHSKFVGQIKGFGEKIKHFFTDMFSKKSHH